MCPWCRSLKRSPTPSSAPLASEPVRGPQPPAGRRTGATASLASAPWPPAREPPRDRWPHSIPDKARKNSRHLARPHEPRKPCLGTPVGRPGSGSKLRREAKMAQSVSDFVSGFDGVGPASPYGHTDRPDALLLGAVQQVMCVGPGPARGGLPLWRLNRVTRHIEANISGRLSLRELAEVAQMSTSHFSRTFHATVGMSPHGYVTR